MSAVVEHQAQAPSLLAKLAGRFSVEPNKMLSTLKGTAFRGDVTNEQMMALLIVADQYGLNPWTKEIYAFPDKQSGIIPVIGVDGWNRILNSNPMFDGVEFNESPEVDKAGLPIWIESVIYRRDRSHPTRVKEFMAECRRDTGPWRSHPRRLLRHKALIQGARIAFGFAGIYDEDEARRIIEGDVGQTRSSATIDDLNKRITHAKTAAEDVQQADEQPPMSFAQVAEKINAAKDLDALDIAGDLIGAVSDPGQRDELSALYQQARAALQPAA